VFGRQKPLAVGDGLASVNVVRQRDDEGTVAIMLAFDHSFADGYSICHAAKTFLQFLCEGRDAPVERVMHWQPSVEEACGTKGALWPVKALARWVKLFQFGLPIPRGASVFAIPDARLTVAQCVADSHTEVDSVVLSEAATTLACT
jgi:hypothetical protein